MLRLEESAPVVRVTVTQICGVVPSVRVKTAEPRPAVLPAPAWHRVVSAGLALPLPDLKSPVVAVPLTAAAGLMKLSTTGVTQRTPAPTTAPLIKVRREWP